jgi:hypothetical protein
MVLKRFMLAMAIFLIATVAYSADWSENSVSYLRGDNFEVGNRSRTIMTFEHMSVWKYGDNYFFLDIADPFVEPNQSITEMYSEWWPRFGLGKIFGFYDPDRFLKDVSVVFKMEQGVGSFVSRAALYGLGFDFNIPGFMFFNYHFFLRDSLDAKGTTFQSNFFMYSKFKVKNLKFKFTGFIDFIHGDEGSGMSLIKSTWYASPQLLWDVGDLFTEENKIYTGIEYQYWQKKYGTPGYPSESNPQWVLQWVF